jgi:hypothetical protein
MEGKSENKKTNPNTAIYPFDRILIKDDSY